MLQKRDVKEKGRYYLSRWLFLCLDNKSDKHLQIWVDIIFLLTYCFLHQHWHCMYNYRHCMSLLEDGKDGYALCCVFLGKHIVYVRKVTRGYCYDGSLFSWSFHGQFLQQILESPIIWNVLVLTIWPITRMSCQLTKFASCGSQKFYSSGKQSTPHRCCSDIVMIQPYWVYHSYKVNRWQSQTEILWPNLIRFSWL